MFPTSAKEVQALGWDWIDVIFFTGDAFVDHPSFGTACISRWLQKAGYRVAVVPQPNWRDDLRDFRKLGAPRLYFAVNAGAMDSMVNHYTAAKRLRHDDAYTPEGRAGARPDRAVTVYTRILKQLWPDVPVVIGGVEASLRRLTHYDYWDDRLMPSILVDSGADWLCYGMGEKPMLDLTRAIENGWSRHQIQKLPQIAFYLDGRFGGTEEEDGSLNRGRPRPREGEGPAPRGVGGMESAKRPVDVSLIPVLHTSATVAESVVPAVCRPLTGQQAEGMPRRPLVPVPRRRLRIRVSALSLALWAVATASNPCPAQTSPNHV